jgi:hypothetical protein
MANTDVQALHHRLGVSRAGGRARRHRRIEPREVGGVELDGGGAHVLFQARDVLGPGNR